MSSPLFSFPPGLLGYLRQKVGGRAPDKFSDTLQPVIEIGRLYGRLELQTELVTTPGGSGWDQFALTVPPNERHLVMSVHFRLIFTAAGQAANAVGGLRMAGQVIYTRDTLAAFSAILGEPVTFAQTFPDGIMLEPGDALAFRNDLPGNAPVGGWSMFFAKTFYRLPI